MSSARTALIGSNSRLQMALEHWKAYLGTENVILDPAGLRAAETATFETRVTVPAIVRPGNREDVQQVLRIANQWRIPVYPVSGGCNWGYGSRVPEMRATNAVPSPELDCVGSIGAVLASVTPAT